MGTHQDLIGGHEAKSLLIADSERIAHCGPSLIAPNAESGAECDSSQNIRRGDRMCAYGASLRRSAVPAANFR